MLTIKIHFKTCYGQCLKLIGDSQVFGEWNAFKGKRLSYQTDDFWFIEIPFDNSYKDLAYKFVLCSENEKQETMNIVRREENENHFFSFSHYDKTSKIEIFEFWNYPSLKKQVEIDTAIQSFIQDINRKNSAKIDELNQQLKNNNGTFGKFNPSLGELTYRLSLDDFDPRGTFKSDGSNITKPRLRGGLPYHKPNNNYFRKGFKILDKFPNDGWFNKDGNSNE